MNKFHVYSFSCYRLHSLKLCEAANVKKLRDASTNVHATFWLFQFVIVVRYSWAHPKVRTQYGFVEGKVLSIHFGPNTEVEQFLGIPYALPPVGDRRFEHPKAPVAYRNGEMMFCLLSVVCLIQICSKINILHDIIVLPYISIDHSRYYLLSWDHSQFEVRHVLTGK